MHPPLEPAQYLAIRYTERLAEAGAVAEGIDWFNFRRLHGEIRLVPPVEYETQHNPPRATCSAGRAVGPTSNALGCPDNAREKYLTVNTAKPRNPAFMATPLLD